MSQVQTQSLVAAINAMKAYAEKVAKESQEMSEESSSNNTQTK